jgi:hypothetical protein
VSKYRHKCPYLDRIPRCRHSVELTVMALENENENENENESVFTHFAFY